MGRYTGIHRLATEYNDNRTIVMALMNAIEALDLKNTKVAYEVEDVSGKRMGSITATRGGSRRVVIELGCDAIETRSYNGWVVISSSVRDWNDPQSLDVPMAMLEEVFGGAKLRSDAER